MNKAVRAWVQASAAQVVEAGTELMATLRYPRRLCITIRWTPSMQLDEHQACWNVQTQPAFLAPIAVTSEAHAEHNASCDDSNEALYIVICL
jgi:hypothetical protein